MIDLFFSTEKPVNFFLHHSVLCIYVVNVLVIVTGIINKFDIATILEKLYRKLKYKKF